MKTVPALSSQEQLASRTTLLSGKALLIWRAVWVLIALFDLGVLIYGYPAFIAQQYTLCSDLTRQTCGSIQLLAPQMAALNSLHLTLNMYETGVVVLDSLAALAFLLVGALIFWHKSNDRMGLFISLLFITFGCLGIDEVFIDPIQSPPLPIAIFGILVIILQWPALGLLFYLFPDGRFVPRWSWLLTSLFLIQLVAYLLPYPYDVPHWPNILQFLQMLVVYGSAVAVLLYRYFAVATPLQRQQIKWFAFGFAATLFLSLLGVLFNVLFPDLNKPDSWVQLTDPLITPLAYLTIPLGIGMALLRYRLWDIDVLINRALVYGLLTATLLALYLGVVLGGQALLSGVIGPGNNVMLVVSTLVVAALFQPLRHRIQTLIDQRFYRYKYDAARTIEAFSATLHHEIDLPQLQTRLVDVIEETMVPAHVSLWLCQVKQEQASAKGDGL